MAENAIQQEPSAREDEWEPEPGQEGQDEPGVEPDVEVDPELAARRAAALAHVRQFGDPVLRARARPVDRFDGALAEEVARMGRLMDDAIGVGLAATQVGVLHRVLVYRVQQASPVAALVNPEIEWTGDELETLEEGCLSLPGVHVDVERPVHIRVRARDEHGRSLTVEASGLEARVIQHEVDHLDGVLILDRISRSQRKDADAGPARSAAVRLLSARRSPVRTVYLGTSEFAAGGAALARGLGASSVAGGHAPGPPPRAGPARCAAAGRRGRPGAGDRAGTAGLGQRRGLARDDRQGRP